MLQRTIANVATLILLQEQNMTALICRILPDNTPVAFIADTLSGNTIDCWKPGDKSLSTVDINYYKASQPISVSDCRHLAEQYKQAMNDKNVTIRQRLPRAYRDIPSVLSEKQENQPPTAEMNKPTGKPGKRTKVDDLKEEELLKLAVAVVKALKEHL